MESFLTSQPIYTQLADLLKKQIVRGQLRPGDKLPSVRELAIRYTVNPNTVQRTYRELEQEGVVEVRRGQGTFVIEDDEIIQRLRETLKQEYVATFVRDMREMGFTLQEMKESVKRMWEEEVDD
ncbi:MAG: GntR family transcriptional regulator [Novibacillus thermophilus]|jgi:GntR family transcriptional regulator|uniref:GntR family transcriptional regulator n=1 Tax=Novibacillus thermophilus TaxID=1471761 RepID=A0A1U9K475_9BACL|nr:GntR family transcriptional regulator [Novibacillus thermophilus]AQS54847.1 GntR family transcriptional regulator [Novibacillus thermophilus]